MVYAVIIHTVIPGSCKVLFSRTYGQDENLASNTSSHISNGDCELGGTAISEDRAAGSRKQLLRTIAERVQADYTFAKSVCLVSMEDEFKNFSEMQVIPSSEMGFTRFPKGEPFSNEKIAVWLASLHYGFTVLCERNENRLLAELALKQLICYMRDQLKIYQHPDVFYNRPDQIAYVVDKFIPNGQLICMNQKLIKQFEKELDTQLKS